MSTEDKTPRRGFLGRVLGTAAAAGFSLGGVRLAGAEPAQAKAAASGPDAWINEVKGTHRSLFDFPRHNNAMPLLHILNYLNTYKEGYKAATGTAAAVGTFYGVGPGCSIPLAFNDAMWAKYGLGEYSQVKDTSGKFYTRNVFYQMKAEDGHLLMQQIGSPGIPELAPLVPALSIESLQKMGTKFLMCQNAFGAWTLDLQARGKGKVADLQKDLMANLLPGVTVVPAMVIAIEKAQRAGITYNRQ